MGFKVIATGSYLPKNIIYNEYFKDKLNLDNDWIVARTGIQKRHFVDCEDSLELAVNAAKKCIENIDKNRIKGVIVASTTPPNLTPSISNMLQAKLDLNEKIFCIDINAACSGFIYGINLANALLNSYSQDEYILLIGSETLSKIVDFKDKSSAFLFGDGAGAFLLKRDDFKPNFVFGSKGNDEVLICKSENTKEKNSKLHLIGKEVYKFAVKKTVDMAEELLESNNLNKDDIDYYFLHQANERIVKAFANHMDIDIKKIPINIDKVGNTSAASLPILIDEVNKRNQLKDNMKIMILGFGGGLSWGGCLTQW